MATLRSLSVIEFPGVLRDERSVAAALHCLGGERAVRDATSASFRVAPSAAPSLTLRTGAHTSASNIAAEKPLHLTNLFVLDIDTQPSPPRSRASSCQAHVSSPSVARDDENSSSRSLVATAQVLGRVDTLMRFRSLADYCYHTYATTAVQPPLNNDSTSNQVAADAVFRSLLEHTQSTQSTHCLVDRLRARKFARSALEYGTFDYCFRQYSLGDAQLPTRTELIPNHPLGDDRRSAADRIALLHHRVSPDVAHVPDKPQPHCDARVVRGRAEYEQCLRLVRKLFALRPVWVRRALQEGMPKQLASQFKRVIPRVAYTFQGTGAFYQAWIRYGYDPRKDASARQFQTVEVRITSALVMAARAQCEQDKQRAAVEAQQWRAQSAHGCGSTRDARTSTTHTQGGDAGARADGDAAGSNDARANKAAPDDAERSKARERARHHVGEGKECGATADNLLGSNGREAQNNRRTGGCERATRDGEVDRFSSGSGTAVGAPHAVGSTLECDGWTFRMPSSFTLSQIPRKRNNFVQVCDITLPDVVRFCERERATERFHKRYGFFSQHAHERLMRVIKRTLMELCKQQLGAERVAQIMRGDYSSVSQLMVNRKRRLFLKDVIRPRKRQRARREWRAGARGSAGEAGAGAGAGAGARRSEPQPQSQPEAEAEAEGTEAAVAVAGGEEELAEVDGFALLDDEEDDDEDDEDEDDEDDVEVDDEEEDEDEAGGGAARR